MCNLLIQLFSLRRIYFLYEFCRNTNNLKNVELKIPLGTFTCVTGVSGGGKSSLILETLFKGLNKELNGSREQTGVYDKIIGLENIDKIIDIDQSPIGRIRAPIRLPIPVCSPISATRRISK